MGNPCDIPAPSNSSRDKRGITRRRLTYPVWLAKIGDEALSKATLVDVSENGAKVTVDDPHSFPDEIILVLSKQARLARRCRVIWRDDRCLGLTFIKAALGQRSHDAMRSTTAVDLDNLAKSSV